MYPATPLLYCTRGDTAVELTQAAMAWFRFVDATGTESRQATLTIAGW